MIEETAFPDALAILPSDTYVFDMAPGATEMSLRIVGQRKLNNGVGVTAVDLGLLAFDFKGTSLGGFRRLRSNSGLVPEAVMDNEDAMLRLQTDRLRVAVFVSACIYGTHAKANHSTIRGAVLPGLDDVFSYAQVRDGRLGLAQFELERLLAKMRERKKLLDQRKLHSASISLETLTQALDLADRLLASVAQYETTDPVTLMVLSYQAMVLHGLQHPGPSIAVAAVVLEAAVTELLYALGLVEGRPARLPLLDPAPAPMSRSRVKTLRFNGALGELKELGVLDAYLVQRIDAVRKARNDFMHEAKAPGPRQSGDALTAVRDVLRICTGERGFELNTGFAYRC
ncbi:hypothetical protein [Caulobacter sp. UNC279MFTsu5.1]|uniref:hypothetical protein n=1 Tax=Caulobacter sp. UNC279MFTsu5.1 TaxID=1502775 RepID=UPI0008F33C1B|nr:hypothetical protein [Caulobacter sp. UNC279MFTsu5.1]SFI55076.1 hypothetical protein SAMN02799626_00101 [Caulobacter sp. UNC279MFTsu5.1]